MGLILFFVVCALVFLFYKVDKLSREIYSLELDIAVRQTAARMVLPTQNVKTHLSENRRLPMARRQAIRHSSQSICLAAMACLRPQGRAMMKEPH